MNGYSFDDLEKQWDTNHINAIIKLKYKTFYLLLYRYNKKIFIEHFLTTQHYARNSEGNKIALDMGLGAYNLDRCP